MATLKQRLHRKNSSGTYDTVYFETSADCITGTLGIAHGGTGATTAANARSTLGITPANIGAAASSHNHSASNITSGTLPVTRGGTGVTSLEELKNVLGISSGNVRIIYGYINLPSTGWDVSKTITFSRPFSNTPLVSLLPTEPPENGYVQLFLSSVSTTNMTILSRGATINRVYYSAIGI